MANRPYNKLRLATERFGGSMQWVRTGSSFGTWQVQIGRWQRSFPSTGGSFPGLDELYIPTKQPPTGYRDYSQNLLPGAIATFVSSVVDVSASSLHWTDEEVECLVFCYFWMLDEENAGRSFNKAALFRALAEGVLSVNQRTVKAAERKSMNVSAVLDEVGLKFVTGLLPDRHYQGLLKERVLAELERRESIEPQDLELTEDRQILQQRVDNLLRRGKLGRPQGNKRPRRKQGLSIQFQRSPQVAAWVLQESRGICCLCNQTAPFLKPDRTPYLEVHHVHPLGDGGKDVIENAVALCPNCHREIHHGADTAALREKLYTSVDWLKREH